MSKFLNVKPTIRDLGGSYRKVVEDKEKKADYRRGFGFGETDNVLFLIFDLPHEHEFRKYLFQVNPKDRVLIWPIDNRAREKIEVLEGKAISRVNGLIVDSLDFHRTADKVILFRKDWCVPELVAPWELVGA